VSSFSATVATLGHASDVRPFGGLGRIGVLRGVTQGRIAPVSGTSQLEVGPFEPLERACDPNRSVQWLPNASVSATSLFETRQISLIGPGTPPLYALS
jgi:hypothetical protein